MQIKPKTSDFELEAEEMTDTLTRGQEQRVSASIRISARRCLEQTGAMLSGAVC